MTTVDRGSGRANLRAEGEPSCEPGEQDQRYTRRFGDDLPGESVFLAGKDLRLGFVNHPVEGDAERVAAGGEVDPEELGVVVNRGGLRHARGEAALGERSDLKVEVGKAQVFSGFGGFVEGGLQEPIQRDREFDRFLKRVCENVVVRLDGILPGRPGEGGEIPSPLADGAAAGACEIAGVR